MGKVQKALSQVAVNVHIGKMQRRRRNRIRHWGPFALLLNLFVFVAVAFALGGDAVNGRRAGGVHYLSSGGVETEVAPAVWWYSQIHATVTFGSFALYLVYRLWRRSRR